MKWAQDMEVSSAESREVLKEGNPSKLKPSRRSFMLVRTEDRRKGGINVKKMKSLVLREQPRGIRGWGYTWDQKPTKGELASDSA